MGTQPEGNTAASLPPSSWGIPGQIAGKTLVIRSEKGFSSGFFFLCENSSALEKYPVRQIRSCIILYVYIAPRAMTIVAREISNSKVQQACDKYRCRHEMPSINFK